MLPRFCMRFRIKYICGILAVLFLLDFFGVFTHLFEINFNNRDFNYPLEGDVIKYANKMRHGERPNVAPINIYNYTFLSNCKHKCNNADQSIIAPRLVFIVKSAMPNFARRNAIRNSWGFEKRLSDVIIRTVFVLGTSNQATDDNESMQKLIDIELENYRDIVQADFIDTYFNNTIKTMMGFRWAIKFCNRSKFYMFVDDDFYVSAKNVLRFIRNPVNYPEYLEEADETLRKLARRLHQSDLLNSSSIDLNEMKQIVDKNNNIQTVNNKQHIDELKKYISGQDKKRVHPNMDGVEANNNINRHLLEMELASDVKLFSGFVFSSSPHRHKSSKWHVSLDEYPWHMWPPYVTAGAFILSREALIHMYYVSMFTKHFR